MKYKVLKILFAFLVSVGTSNAYYYPKQGRSYNSDYYKYNSLEDTRKNGYDNDHHYGYTDAYEPENHDFGFDFSPHILPVFIITFVTSLINAVRGNFYFLPVC